MNVNFVKTPALLELTHTSLLGYMSVYQIFLNCQCLNDFIRVWTYDLGTLAI